MSSFEKPWRVRFSRLVSAVGAERFGPGSFKDPEQVVHQVLLDFCSKFAWMVISSGSQVGSLVTTFSSSLSAVMPGHFL